MSAHGVIETIKHANVALFLVLAVFNEVHTWFLLKREPERGQLMHVTALLYLLIAIESMR